MAFAFSLHRKLCESEVIISSGNTKWEFTGKALGGILFEKLNESGFFTCGCIFLNDPPFQCLINSFIR